MALYGGLTALATFDRAELGSKVIGSVGFRESLELHPQARGRAGARAAAALGVPPPPPAERGRRARRGRAKAQAR